MAFGIIYKITNKINGKVYIGQTIKSLVNRWKAHCYTAKYEQRRASHFLRALRKYKKDDFSYEVVAEANTREELNYLEKEWIAKCDSMKNGYNSTTGGEHPVWDDKSKKKASWSRQSKNIADRHDRILRFLAAGLEEDEILDIIIPKKRQAKEKSFLESDIYADFLKEFYECEEELLNGENYEKTPADWEMEEELARLDFEVLYNQ